MFLIHINRMDRKGGDNMTRKTLQRLASKRLVPLNVQVSTDQLQWIIDRAVIEECSMGRIVRQLIESRLHEATEKKEVSR